VGFFRTYYRPKDGGPAQFTPADEPSQTTLGEQVLTAFKEAGGEVTAEDLGVVPDFVRATLARLEVPGYKVFRWERQWHTPGQPYVDPVDYPRVSVAVSGTHDTETTAEWWTVTSPEERAAVLDIPSVRAHLTADDLAVARDGVFTTAVRDALLEALYAGGSDLLIVPIQDVFGWTDRINTPATVNGINWTWRLPWDVEHLAARPEAQDAARRLRAWAGAHGR
jgi:4-alpha-glucanotransferase